jgi:hypothetical protein
MLQRDGKRCSVVLNDQSIGTTGQKIFQTQGCFDDQLFGVNRWSLQGYDLVLEDGFGKRRITLRATGPNLLKGGGFTLTR